MYALDSEKHSASRNTTISPPNTTTGYSLTAKILASCDFNADLELSAEEAGDLLCCDIGTLLEINYLFDLMSLRRFCE